MMYAIALSILAYACDPALTALFTPPHPQAGRYEVCTMAEPIELVSEGAAIEALEPLEAFGGAAPYNRSALARLYGGTRVRVARRWRIAGDTFESETLLSPYPDASLAHLIRGTMLIKLTLDRGAFRVGAGPGHVTAGHVTAGHVTAGHVTAGRPGRGGAATAFEPRGSLRPARRDRAAARVDVARLA